MFNGIPRGLNNVPPNTYISYDSTIFVRKRKIGRNCDDSPENHRGLNDVKNRGFFFKMKKKDVTKLRACVEKAKKSKKKTNVFTQSTGAVCQLFSYKIEIRFPFVPVCQLIYSRLCVITAGESATTSAYHEGTHCIYSCYYYNDINL